MTKRLLRPEHLPWRVGGKNGRTIHAQLSDEPDDTDPLIGLMDTRALAEAVVRDHNRALAGGDRITRMPKRVTALADRLTRTPKRAVATPPNPRNPPPEPL